MHFEQLVGVAQLTTPLGMSKTFTSACERFEKIGHKLAGVWQSRHDLTCLVEPGGQPAAVVQVSETTTTGQPERERPATRRFQFSESTDLLHDAGGQAHIPLGIDLRHVGRECPRATCAASRPNRWRISVAAACRR